MSIGFVVMPVEIIKLLDQRILAALGTSCKAIEYIYSVCITSNVFSVMAIAIERYRYIVNIVKYPINMCFSLSLIALIWISASIYELKTMFLFDIRDQAYDRGNTVVSTEICAIPVDKAYLNDVVVIVNFCVLYFIPISVVSTLYWLIIRKLSKEMPQTLAMGNRIKRRRKVMKMFLIATLTIAVTHLPYHVWRIFTQVNGVFPYFRMTKRICDAFSYMGGWINVFVYVLWNDLMRETLKKTKMVTILQERWINIKKHFVSSVGDEVNQPTPIAEMRVIVPRRLFETRDIAQ